MISRLTFRTIFSGLVFLLSVGSVVHALPPLGLTQITPAKVSAGLEIIDGMAYLSGSDGIWTVDSLGSTSFVAVASPTSVVKAFDGALYFVSNEATGPALRRIDQPNVAITSWEVDGYAVGVDSQLRVLGNLADIWSDNAAVKFLPDGCDGGICTEPLIGNISFPYLVAVTPQGYVLGSGGIPGTIGSSPALWGPDNQFMGFAFGSDIPGTIRDRDDGDWVNVSNGFALILGKTTSSELRPGLLSYHFEYEIVRPDGAYLERADISVSHGDFTVLSDYLYGITPSQFYAFFPGINPDHPNRAVPLVDIFPQLATIDIDSVSSAASVDGFLYLTIRGSDGLFLFGAPDPSLVPEPATLALLMSLAMPLALRRV